MLINGNNSSFLFELFPFINTIFTSSLSFKDSIKEKKLWSKERVVPQFPEKIENFFSVTAFIIGVFISLLPVLHPIIIDGFTSSDRLVIKYLKKEFTSFNQSQLNIDSLTLLVASLYLYPFNGAVCNDGWISHSQGRGTCSHHGGVNYYFYRGECMKSRSECEKEAIELLEKIKNKARRRSWIKEYEREH